MRVVDKLAKIDAAIMISVCLTENRSRIIIIVHQ
jgi:hypothetical protein